MATIDNIIKREDFKQLKSSIKETFGTLPTETISMENEKYKHLFEIEIKEKFFKKTEIKLSFEYKNTKEPILIVDCEIITDGIHNERNEQYYFAKYKDQFSALFLSVEDYLIEWLLNKEGKLYLFNKISDKLARFKTKELTEKDFINLEQNFLLVIQKQLLNEELKENTDLNNEKKEFIALFKKLEKMNVENAINYALDIKNYKHLKKLSIHL